MQITSIWRHVAKPAVLLGLGVLANMASREPVAAAVTYGTTLFVSDSYQNRIDIYDTGNHLLGKIGKLNYPEGLFIDASSNVWVANNKGGDVLEFSKPYAAPVKRLIDPNGGHPNDVAVDPAHGLVGVPSYNYGVPSARVTFYRASSTRPCKTLVDSRLSSISSATFDEHGDLYIVAATKMKFYPSVVGIVRGGCAANRISVLATTNDVSGAKWVRASAGRILVLINGPQRIDEIDAYEPAVGNTLGAPIARTSFANPAGGIFGPFALTQGGKHVWITSREDPYVAIYEYDYPGGGNASKTILTFAFPESGLGVIPSNLP